MALFNYTRVMKNIQYSGFFKKPAFILSLLLVIFFLKGLIWVSISPIFQGPDEQTHYSTIQFFAEPDEKKLPTVYTPNVPQDEKSTIDAFHFSEEIIETAKITRFDEIKHRDLDSHNFSDSQNGEKEEAMSEKGWKTYIEKYPVRIPKINPLYYTLSSFIEKLFSSESILFRFFAIRIFSVIIGMGVILLSYFIAIKSGFGKKAGLLTAATLSFLPMFSFVSTIVNLDILFIFFFSVFTLGITLIIGRRHIAPGIILGLIGAAMGIITKGPAIILFAVLFPIIIFSIIKNFKFFEKKRLLYTALISLAIVLLVFFLFSDQFLLVFARSNCTSDFGSFFESVSNYLKKTFSLNSFQNTSFSYWGYFGWLDAKISENSLRIIHAIELIAVIGLFKLFFSKEKKDFLPEKKYLLFFFVMILLLQAAIRFYDWRSFDCLGEIKIGTPGRYFLPNVISHLILVISGIGAFFKKESGFLFALKALVAFSLLFNLYSILNIIIPRYYL